ncbi:hypothetical protein FJTKL_00368 [Diaporthe vaccinii]|uniref:Uncharacterized protein n=1 Tax=Diaporthe vaccinii TaxID=105482 RepID=A0ABR4E3B0_9PEZI
MFTSTYKITTSSHAATPIISLSLDIISYMEVRPWGNDDIVPVPAAFVSASSTDKGEYLFHPLPGRLKPSRAATGPVPGPCSRATRRRGLADLEVLVGSLLPLARHGVWWGLGEHAHGSEDGQGGTEAGEDVEYDLLVLVGGGLRTWAVRAESNPIGYEAFVSAFVGWSVRMGRPAEVTMLRWGSGWCTLTGLLLLEGQIGPVLLHAVAQSHPQLSLLLQRHALPSLLDVGQGRVGNGVGGGGSSGDHGGRGGGLAAGPGDGGAQGG